MSVREVWCVEGTEGQFGQSVRVAFGISIADASTSRNLVCAFVWVFFVCG